MPKGTTTCNNVLKLIFNATNWANVADNAASSPLTNLFLSLHTADPGVGGSQTTNETSYTNYARVSVARTTGGWTAATTAQTENVALLQFPQCGATGATVTHVAIGTLTSGAGVILYSGALNSSLSVANLIQPQFSAGALTVTEA
ncbi:MAG: hypothetical protein ACK528_06340 [Alphaproteobacteria bacterium]|jgi:hypothetical protein